MDFTDFLVKTSDSNEAIEFRHTAQTVRELLESEGEFIFDLYGSQFIRKSEIVSVKLDSRPYVSSYHNKFERSPRNLIDLWNWVYSLTEKEREDIKNKHYMVTEGYIDYHE